MAPRNVWPKLVIVEGIMGSGKSTLTRNIARRLEESGIAAIGITEGVNPHPIRFDWDEPWSEVSPADVARSQIAKWRSYVAGSLSVERISIIDGQLFHGNLTALLLLEADRNTIAAYCREIVAAIAPPRPLLIYLRQDDIDHAIRIVATQRGETWVDYQVNWKLQSPYARRHGLASTALSPSIATTEPLPTSCSPISKFPRSASRPRGRSGRCTTTSSIAC